MIRPHGRPNKEDYSPILGKYHIGLKTRWFSFYIYICGITPFSKYQYERLTSKDGKMMTLHCPSPYVAFYGTFRPPQIMLNFLRGSFLQKVNNSMSRME